MQIGLREQLRELRFECGLQLATCYGLLLLDGALVFGSEITEFSLVDLGRVLVVALAVIEGEYILSDETVPLAVSLVQSGLLQNQCYLRLSRVLPVMG